jgi:hypothetical protein
VLGTRGFIALGLVGWIAVAGGAALLLSWGAVYVQTQRLDAAEGEIAAFRAMSKAQEEFNKQQAELRDRLTQKQEAEYEARIADISARYKRVREPGGSQLPRLSDAAAVISCPDRQADVAGGLVRLESGVLALLERGDKAIERTMSCKGWIEGQRLVNQETP